MKVLFSTLFFLFMSILSVNAQDKVSFSKKDAFNSLEKNVAVSSIILTDFPNGLPEAAKQFLENNSSFITYTVKDNVLNLEVNLDKNEKVIYLKLFSQLGIHQVEIKKGKETGVYTIEDFLNLYNL